MSTTTTTTDEAPKVLHASDVGARRKRTGLSRAALAAYAHCSVSYLQNIDAGVIPSTSEVMPRLLEALTRLESQNDNDPAGNRAEVTTYAGDDRADETYSE